MVVLGTTIHELLAATPLPGGTIEPVLVDPRAKHEDDGEVARMWMNRKVG
jgi:hypothetical protein